VPDLLLDDAVSRTRYRARRGLAPYPDDLELLVSKGIADVDSEASVDVA
jgi:hypothetical protein